MQYVTGNRSPLTGFGAALDFHFRSGPGRFGRRIRSFAERGRVGLVQIPGVKINSPTHPELAGAGMVDSVEGVPAAQLEDELWARPRLRPGSFGDPLGVRQSCQIYKSEGKIDGTLELVRELAKRSGAEIKDWQDAEKVWALRSRRRRRIS